LEYSSGGASFVAEVNQLGIDAVGCKPLFSLDLEALIDKGKADFKHVVEKVSVVSHLYNWDFY